jgi:hypothetical protein
VSIDPACLKFLAVEASAVIATGHREFALVIIKFHHDTRRSRVTVCVDHSLTSNSEHLVNQMALQSIAASSTFEAKFNYRERLTVGRNHLREFGWPLSGL